MKRWHSLFLLPFLCLPLLFSCANNDDEKPWGSYPPLSPIKNTILMIGDGMGKNHEEAGRIQKESPLAWDDKEAFPYFGEVETASLTSKEHPSIPTDSAAAATAMATGEKVYNSSIGKSSTGEDLPNIMEIAHTYGKSTGIVTSDVLSGATPASFSAHAKKRTDTEEIIASQQNDFINLYLGSDKNKDYVEQKEAFQTNGFYFLNSTKKLTKNIYSEEKILGAFPDVAAKEEHVPSSVRLKTLVTFALDYLSQNENGFCLMIEGARIDKRAHESKLSSMIYELLDFDQCVTYVAEWARRRGDTNVFVTADHETGGLTLKEGVSKDQLLSSSSYEWTAPGNHTTRNVSYYALGKESNLYQNCIDNTSIFYAMKEVVTDTTSNEK